MKATGVALLVECLPTMHKALKGSPGPHELDMVELDM